mgnify:FL=1
MDKVVAKAEAEFYLRVEFEVGEVEIAAESAGEEEVGGLGAEVVVALFGDIECRHDTGCDIWARVAIAQTGEFKVEGKDYEGGFEILTAFGPGIVFTHRDVAVAEIHARSETEIEICPQSVVNQTVHAESGLKRGLVDKPLLTGFANEAVVGECEILRVDSHREAEVPAAHVGIRTVHQLIVQILAQN